MNEEAPHYYKKRINNIGSTATMSSDSDADSWVSSYSFSPERLWETQGETTHRTPSATTRSWCDEKDVLSYEETRFELWYDEEDDCEDDESVPYSDWKIVVEAPSGRKRTFHVHKQVLTFASDYFETLFEGETQFTEHTEEESTFQFPEVAVKNFHCILDYAYNENYTTEAPEKISVLLFLADYFQMPFLSARCKVHFRQWKDHPADFRDVYFFTYVGCYKELHDSFLREFLVNWGANSLGKELSSDSHDRLTRKVFLRGLEVDLFLDIIHNEERDRQDEEWLEVLACFCSQNDTSAEFYLELIDDKILFPKITGNGCLSLLKLMRPYFDEAFGAKEMTRLHRVQARLVLGLHQDLLCAKTMSEIDAMDLTGSLHLETLKALLTLYDQIVPGGCCRITAGTILRDGIRNLKIMVKRSVPLTVAGAHEEWLNGTYYPDNGAWKHIEKRKSIVMSDEGEWAIEDGRPMAYYKTTPLSTHKYAGFPPFHGWITPDGTPCDIVISF